MNRRFVKEKKGMRVPVFVLMIALIVAIVSAQLPTYCGYTVLAGTFSIGGELPLVGLPLVGVHYVTSPMTFTCPFSGYFSVVLATNNPTAHMMYFTASGNVDSIRTNVIAKVKRI